MNSFAAVRGYVLAAALVGCLCGESLGQGGRASSGGWPGVVDHVVAGPVFLVGFELDEGLELKGGLATLSLGDAPREAWLMSPTCVDSSGGVALNLGDMVFVGCLENSSSATLLLELSDGLRLKVIPGDIVAVGTHRYDLGDGFVGLSIARGDGGPSSTGTFKKMCTCSCGGDDFTGVELAEGELCSGLVNQPCVDEDGDEAAFVKCRERYIVVDSLLGGGKGL